MMSFKACCTVIYLLHTCCCSERTIQKKHIYTTNSDFLTVTTVEAFVDKTLLLKYLFHGQPFKLVTAPRRFGKSTNVDMVKTFLSIAVDSEGRRVNKNHTESHKIFRKLQIYHREKPFFYENFGRYPVLHVDFKANDPIKSDIDALRVLRVRIHESFKQHSYLCHSEYLDSEEKKVSNLWCYHHTNMTVKDVTLGLIYLSKLLYKHFNSIKVFVIIDEYDSLITAATFMAETEQLRNILSLITQQLLQIIKSKHIERALVCGVSALSSLLLSSGTSRKFMRYRFLEDHPLVDFFGFTEEEVRRLFERKIFNLDSTKIKKARTLYSGYISKKGTKIWSIYSVLRFLQDGEAETYLPPSIYVEHIMNAYRIPVVEKAVDTLLKDKPVKMNFDSRITASDFINLRKMYSTNPYYADANTELFLLHLLELGYLTYVKVPESSPKNVFVKLPNHETKQCLMEHLWNIQVFSKL